MPGQPGPLDIFSPQRLHLPALEWATSSNAAGWYGNAQELMQIRGQSRFSVVLL